MTCDQAHTFYCSESLVHQLLGHLEVFQFFFTEFTVNVVLIIGIIVAFKSREDHRKQLELEEARKAGLAPAELDEDGKEINPHIPQYMSSAPWYLNAERPVCSMIMCTCLFCGV